MHVIIDKIRLKPGIDPKRFETWVERTDYQACSDLKSVQQFSVQRVSAPGDAGFHYFEIIHVTSQEDFARDMETPVFGALVQDFSQMAEVVETFAGDRIEPAFQRDRE